MSYAWHGTKAIFTASFNGGKSFFLLVHFKGMDERIEIPLGFLEIFQAVLLFVAPQVFLTVAF